jgi:ribosome assembly protein RRB1
MSSKKRNADEPTVESTTPSASSKKGPAAQATTALEDNEMEMGEFEDPWEDEIEDDEEAGEVYVEESSDDEEESGDEENGNGEAAKPEAVGMDVDSGTKPKKMKPSRKSVTFESDDEHADLDAETYLPGKQIGEDEVLVADMSTYVMLHPVQVEWPCLSFDILRDGLGASRTNVGLRWWCV